MAVWTQNLALQSGNTLTARPGGQGIGLTDENAQRIIAAHRAILSAPANATAQQVWERIAQRCFDIVKADTINYERVQQQAAVVVPDIPEV